MAVTLIRTGAWCRALCADEERERVHEHLSRRFAYPVEGAEYSEAFRARVWDGKVRLASKIKSGVKYPSGIHNEVHDLLTRRGFEVAVDDRRRDAAELPPDVEWAVEPLRDYQLAAVEAAAASDGGILRLPIRSGKTRTAGAIILRLGLRALFLVPADLLLDQTVEALGAALRGCKVTAVGGAEDDDTGDVVVCSVQALSARRGTPWYRWFIRQFGIVFFDEAHTGMTSRGEWQEAALEVDARYKFALSATVVVSRKQQSESAAIWLRGICGPTLHSLSMSELIERDPPVLVRPTIRFVRHDAPHERTKSWSATVVKRCITDCDERNNRLAAEALRYAKEGRRVLVDVARVGHGRLLADLIARGLPPGRVAVLMGSASKSARKKTLDALRSGRVLVVVGTILGVGVDIPELEVVINAEGGKSWVAVVQRMRNLTLCPSMPDKRAIVVEPIDNHHAKLAEHTLERLRTYRQERAFRIEVEPAPATPPPKAKIGGTAWWRKKS